MARTLVEQPTLRDIYRAIFRHRRKAIGFFVVVTAAVTALTVLSPRQYRSEGKLYVRLGRENVTVDPTASMGQGPIVAVPHSRESEINTTVELLLSRVLAEAVVDGLGPGKVLPPGEVISPGKVQTEKRPEETGPGAAVDDRERAVEWIEKHLGVESVRRSNVVVIDYRAHAPEVARAVVDELIEAYLMRHVHMNRTQGGHEFLVEQADRSREELLEAERALRDLKTETGLADPGEQRRRMVQRVIDLEDERAGVARDVAASKARIGHLQETLATLPRTEVREVTTGVGDFGTDGMRQQLYALQMREQEMAAKYTELHPLMQRARQQVAAAEELLSREQATRREVTTEPHAAYEQKQLELLGEQSALAGLEVRAAQLEGHLAEARSQLGILNDNELRIARLQREVDLHDSEYRTYASSLEQSRIDRALEMERISNINVAQPATYEAKPVRPRVLMNLALGMLAGIFGGLLLALAAEYLDHSLGTPEDIEKKLKLPVLVSVPRLRSGELVITGRN